MRFRGFTIIETLVVLVVIVILAAIITPRVVGYMDQARIATAQADVRSIGEALLRFERDVGRLPMFGSGSGFLPDSSANVVRLESAGGTAPTTTGGNPWISGAPTDAPDCSAGCTFHTMGMLLSNALGYPSTSSLAKPFKWKGPYMDVGIDPWGRKYQYQYPGTHDNTYDLFSHGAKENDEKGRISNWK